jgi:hypothetical protein
MIIERRRAIHRPRFDSVQPRLWKVTLRSRGFVYTRRAPIPRAPAPPTRVPTERLLPIGFKSASS